MATPAALRGSMADIGADSRSVTVIIPTHNRAAVVPRAVASALACVRPGDEVIVVDDGSADDTEAVLAPFADRIRYLPVAHGGAGAARNHAVHEARGAFVAFLDSDDEWTPDKLEVQRTLMAERPDIVFCFTDFAARHVGADDVHNYLARWHGDERSWDSILGPAVPYSSIAPLPPGRVDEVDVHIGDLYPEVLSGHFVPTFTLMVNRELAGDALSFAEDLPTYEDLECHARLARLGPAAYIDCETAYQWGHAGPRLTNANTYACTSARVTILERVYGRDPDFLARYGDRYRRELRRQHLTGARWLLRKGRTSEAREELDRAGDAPLAYRAAALVPEWLVPTGLGRRARAAVRSSRESVDG